MFYHKKNICAVKKHNNYFFYESSTNSLIVPTNEIVFERTLDIIKKGFKKCNNLKYITNEAIELFDKQDVNEFNTYNYLSNVPISNKLTLMLAQACNLSCKYCYGEEGQYGHIKKIMPIDIAIRAVDFLLSQSDYKHYGLTLFGGEPLLNLSAIYAIFEYCDKIEKDKNRHFNYSITTNATLLTEDIISEFVKRDLSILISIDGPKHIHDKNRVYKNGSGTFDDILNKLSILKKFNKGFSIRATVDNNDFIYLLDNIDFFISLGAHQVHIANLIKYCDDCTDFPININELKVIAKKYDNSFKAIKDSFVKGENPYYKPFLNALQKINNTNKTLVSCGFMKGTTAVSVDGFLYPCHRFVGMQGFDFGDIYKGIDASKMKKICDALDNSTKKCLSCFAKYICARSCVRDIAKNAGKFIEFPKDYCDLLRKDVVNYLSIYKEIKEKKPELLEEP